MSFTYNRDIPNAPNNPSADQPNMKTNTNSTDDLIKVDHVSFNTANGGYHTIIHETKQASDPVAIVGINQVYAKDYVPDTTVGITDTQLFSLSGGNILSQLTGSAIEPGGNPSESYQWIGKLLIQTGFVAIPAGSDNETGTVTFKDRATGMIPFPNKCFAIVATLTNNDQSDTTASNTLSIGTPKSNTTFKWLYNSSKSNGSTIYDGFYWIAVGY